MNLYGTSHTADAFLNAQASAWVCLQRNGSGGGKPAVVSALLQRPYFAIAAARLLADPMQFDLAWGCNDNKNFDGVCIHIYADVHQKLRAIGAQLNAIPAVRERLAANGCARNTTVGASRVWYALTRDTETLRELFCADLTRVELGGKLIKRHEFKDYHNKKQFVEVQETAPRFLLVTDASFDLPADSAVTLKKDSEDKWHLAIGEKSIAPKIHVTHALRQLVSEMNK